MIVSKSVEGEQLMSDVSQGPGWWQASDGLWYPPEDESSDATAAPPIATTPSPGSVADARRTDVLPFYFDGGAGTYLGTGILAFLITVLTLGIAFPFALVLRERWKAKHTYIEGRRLIFTGTGMGLFGNWIKWLLLIIITIGIYTFWVVPRLTKWKVEKLAFDPRHAIGN